MADLIAGTYPYRNRHAIMEAVQAGLLPHTRCDGDMVHEGCVTVLIRVVAPQMVYYDEKAEVSEADWDLLVNAKLHDVPPDAARGCATKVTP